LRHIDAVIFSAGQQIVTFYDRQTLTISVAISIKIASIGISTS